MKFEEIKTCLPEFFGKLNIFDEEQLSMMKETFTVMKDDIEGMINDKEIENTQEKFQKVLNTILIISNSVLEAPISDDFSKFVLVFSELTFNWNSNTYEDEVLRQLVKHMNNSINTRNKMIDTINISKEFESRMKDLGAWTPPAYDIAEAYLEQLLDENEK
jgi:hypothetical protein